MFATDKAYWNLDSRELAAVLLSKFFESTMRTCDGLAMVKFSSLPVSFNDPFA